MDGNLLKNQKGVRIGLEVIIVHEKQSFATQFCDTGF